MNENIPPLQASSVPPIPQVQTSKLAIWSLVLGILSLTCFSCITALPGVICGHMAMSRIRKSNGSQTGNGLAIGGLITSYLGLVFMLPLMAAIAIPNFVKAREVSIHNACINNLRQIDGAKNEWALEKGKKDGDTPTSADLDPYLKGGFSSLHCPAGGQYSINPVGQPPTCTEKGHVLPGYGP